MIYAWNHMLLPSRASIPFLQGDSYIRKDTQKSVNALTGLCLISTSLKIENAKIICKNVSMPSRTYTSFLSRGLDTN